eukprot:TRINITY_DN30989_c0_g1_i2.p1 TRINITY_DN30989_c0_g1~~TRINITY_DN30989_c0_g1_i2.p1  ORF type:complete len:241 (-),score=53.01 TRINITY_DN30989_c0_g1_i2:26-748(-)
MFSIFSSFCCVNDEPSSTAAVIVDEKDDASGAPAALPCCLQTESSEAAVIGEADEKWGLLSDQEPDPYTGKFVVAIQLGSGNLGLDLDSSASANVVVRAISDGAVNVWNARAPENKQIKPFDRLVAVNGVEGTASDFARSIITDRATFMFQRPQEVKADLQKPGDVGVGLHFSKVSAGLVISGVQDGLLKNWMLRYADANAVKPGDRIVAVNGRYTSAEDLLREIKESPSYVQLTIAHYR